MTIENDNIYLPTTHQLQMILATASYVIVGVDEREDGTPKFDALEVGITHEKAQQAVLALADHYVQEIEAAEKEAQEAQTK